MSVASFTTATMRRMVGLQKTAMKKLSSTTSTFSSTTATGTATATAASNPFKQAFQWYSTKLETHPIITKGLTAGIIGSSGDALCQYYIDKPELEKQGKGEEWFDMARTGRFFVLGLGLVGPWCHAWFGWLGRTFPQLTFKSVATRVALDQLAFTPIILSTFVSSLWTLEHVMDNTTNPENKEPLNVPKRLQETIPSLWMTNIAVWTPVQLFNFGFIKPSYQVLFANVVSLFWNGYISFSTRGNKNVIDDEKAEEELLDVVPLPELPVSAQAPVMLVQRMTTRVAAIREG